MANDLSRPATTNATASPTRTRWVRVVAVLGALALICGAILGFAQWKVRDLQSGDVAWSTPSDGTYSDSWVLAVKGQAYQFTPNREMRIYDLKDGAVRAEVLPASSGLRAAIGDSGYFAIMSVRGVEAYSPEGDQIWSKDTAEDPYITPLAIDGADMTFLECPGEEQSCAIVQVGSDGNERWRYRARQSDLGRSINVGSLGSLEHEPRLREVPSIPVEVTDDAAVMVRDGKPWGDRVRMSKYDDPVQVGNVLIGSSQHGDECRYEAVREGKQEWLASVDCSGVDTSLPRVYAYKDTVMYGYTDQEQILVVAIDVATGKTSETRIDVSGSSEDAGEIYLAPGVVVHRTEGHLTGHALGSGEETWDRTITDDWGGWQAEMDHGLLSLRGWDRGPWSTLAFGQDTPQERVWVIDPATGDTLSEVAASDPLSVHSTGSNDTALLLTETDLMKLTLD